MKDAYFDKEKLSFNQIYDEYKEFIYPFLFYTAGVLFASLVFTDFNDEVYNFMLECFVNDDKSITDLLIISFSVYFSVYSLTVFLGLCMIGFPVLNIIPLIYGFVIGCKICYFYVNYGFNGVGYSLLLIIPQSTVLIITLFFSIKNSVMLSKNIYLLTIKKSDMIEEITFKTYLIKYLKYALFVALTALFNTTITVLLQSIISL